MTPSHAHDAQDSGASATLDDRDVPHPGAYAGRPADTEGAAHDAVLGEHAPGHDSPGGYAEGGPPSPARHDRRNAQHTDPATHRDDPPDSDYGGQGDWTRSAQGRGYRGGPSQQHDAPLDGGDGPDGRGNDYDGGSPPGGSAQRGYYGGSEGSNYQSNAYQGSDPPQGPQWGSEQLPPGTGAGGSPEWRSAPDTPAPRHAAQPRHDDHGHYQQWRNDHLRSLDDDYRAFREERASRFEEEFTAWRRQRRAQQGRNRGGGDKTS